MVVVTALADVTVKALVELNDPRTRAALPLFNVVAVEPLWLMVEATVLLMFAEPVPLTLIALSVLLAVLRSALAPDRLRFNVLAVKPPAVPCDIAVSLVLLSVLLSVRVDAERAPLNAIVPPVVIVTDPVAVMLSDCV